MTTRLVSPLTLTPWPCRTAAATVSSCPARCPTSCPTSFILPTAANATSSNPGAATGHTVRRKRERARKWYADNWQWREWSGSRGSRAVCCFCTCTCAPDSCPAGAHVRCRPLGLARFTCHDQKRRSGSGVTLSRNGPWHDGARHAAATVRSPDFFCSVLTTMRPQASWPGPPRLFLLCQVHAWRCSCTRSHPRWHHST
jgi:hypothetical protein